ncbi:hypothetical protein CRP01_17425 [Flavilitoribacter nigricans DSM 23189 = NBRC 102662]|uniref:Uncharacterized protein n=1 Tax=Flavilitoribacter nigricans (strain ATCC 23147 / DSM 23189 / NBRC 102662 / NCIMB 1420 / SS-2) TaxID=1122177 RepID=A0A2D0N9Z0_FLAN2|nr:hypothetical protein CRP01_17425 [Flavilitoribacter nigricans DSM 23189 = NBRC 102662]
MSFAFFAGLLRAARQVSAVSNCPTNYHKIPREPLVVYYFVAVYIFEEVIWPFLCRCNGPVRGNVGHSKI